MKTAAPGETPGVKNAVPKNERGSRETKRSPFLRGLLIAGIVCLLLIPTYIAIFDYVIHKDSPASERVTSYTSAVLTGPTGQVFTFYPSGSDGEDSFLATLGALISSGDRISTIPPDLQNTYRLEMTGDTGTENYRFYCNAFSADLYYEDANGNCFRAISAYAGKFLNGSYAFELYGQSTTPVLTTAATDEIIPAEMEWFYRTQDGAFSKRIFVETTEEIRTYPIANDIGFTFSLPPDHYTITVTQNGVSTVYNDQNTFTTPQLSEDDRLDVTITALYNEETGVEYYGSVTYRFRMNVVEAAQFAPDRTVMTEGGYLILSCKNVKNAKNLQISAEPALIGDPVIFTLGETVYAAIPAGAAGTKILSVTYGTISDSFELHVTPNTGAKTISHPDWDETLIASIAAVIAEKGSETPTTSLTPSGLFSDYTESDTVKLVSFGDKLALADHNSVPLPFELYQTDRNVSALSFGIVKETGTHPLLGNYIILDHGCGLYTWYCGLSEIRTVAGAVVARGEDIGVAGSTGIGFDGESNVLILTTIGKVAVSAAELRQTPYLP